ncbi:tRNA methyltransferase, Trm1, partial [Dillenia turbinata]
MDLHTAKVKGGVGPFASPAMNITLLLPFPKALIPSSLLHRPFDVHLKSEKLSTKCQIETERGLEFDTGGTFFRRESATGRDLGVLAAILYKKSKGNLRVLDAMCGCGIRSLRYLVEAKADFVLANDANDEYRSVILHNLSRVARVSDGERKWVITHFDANRILADCYLQREFFDLIDIDSFGSDSMFMRTAFGALRLNGLLYLTSTDGYSSGGGAIRDAAILGYHVSPLFSYYSYHGPVFRVMLRVYRGKLPDNRYYGFISYCHNCGHSQAFSWDQLGQMCCPCSNSRVPSSLVVSGPLWTGPLHDAKYLKEMLLFAEKLGWAGGGMRTDLEKLLNQLIDEADPSLPFGYIKLDEVASRSKVNSPTLRAMMDSIQKLQDRTLLLMQLRRTALWQHAYGLQRSSSKADGSNLNVMSAQ